MSRPSQVRTSRRSSSQHSDKSSVTRPRPCERRGCIELQSNPSCIIRISPKCRGSGVTARWHHLSAGEHYCNECFDWVYRSQNPANKDFLLWYDVWKANAKVVPSYKSYITDQCLPYWVQCKLSRCGKWRMLYPGHDLALVKQSEIRCHDCQSPENECVKFVYNPYWVNTLGYTPLLRHTLLTPLVKEYYPEGVGVSPTTVSQPEGDQKKSEGTVEEEVKEKGEEEKGDDDNDDDENEEDENEDEEDEDEEDKEDEEDEDEEDEDEEEWQAEEEDEEGDEDDDDDDDDDDDEEEEEEEWVGDKDQPDTPPTHPVPSGEVEPTNWLSQWSKDCEASLLKIEGFLASRVKSTDNSELVRLSELQHQVNSVRTKLALIRRLSFPTTKVETNESRVTVSMETVDDDVISVRSTLDSTELLLKQLVLTTQNSKIPLNLFMNQLDKAIQLNIIIQNKLLQLIARGALYLLITAGPQVAHTVDTLQSIPLPPTHISTQAQNSSESSGGPTTASPNRENPLATTEASRFCNNNSESNERESNAKAAIVPRLDNLKKRHSSKHGGDVQPYFTVGKSLGPPAKKTKAADPGVKEDNHVEELSWFPLYRFLRKNDLETRKKLDTAFFQKCSSKPTLLTPPLDETKQVVGSKDWLHPFNHPEDGERARAFTPDTMTTEEEEAFPEYSKTPVLEVYLMLRNLVLALWHKNCKEYLCLETCFSALHLPGLIRIWSKGALYRILHFLSVKGYINFGYLKESKFPFPILQGKSEESILVVGAGPAGLGAAQHLKSFGYDVTVLEASSQPGGRCRDDTSLGTTLGLGAMIVTGVENNPILTLCHQMDLPIDLIEEDKCALLFEDGTVVQSCLDSMVDDHFNSTLDELAEWRLTNQADVSLEDKLTEFHLKLQEKNNHVFSKEEQQLLDFHFSNLEFAFGADLSQVSAQHWDHNDKYPQFNGPHASLPKGYQIIFKKLAENHRVHYNVVVNSIQLNEGTNGQKRVAVKDITGRVWVADKVIVCVPVSLLKSNEITFNPPLSEKKQMALNRIGIGIIEKIAVKFPYPFWKSKVTSPHFFGHVNSSREKRGLFTVIYDMSTKGSSGENECYILMSTVCGKALDDLKDATNEILVDIFLQTLKSMFSDTAIPPPLGVLVSTWRKDPYTKMSYSYTAVGCSGSDYVTLAEDSDERIYFAGEATHELYPQTVTGAYLSGIREAAKIISKNF